MKRIISILAVAFLIITTSLAMTGCGSSTSDAEKGNNAEAPIFMAAIGALRGFVDNFPEAAQEATAEDKADLQKDGQDTLDSINQLEEEINKSSEDFTEDEKNEILDQISAMKQSLQQGLDILATK